MKRHRLTRCEGPGMFRGLNPKKIKKRKTKDNIVVGEDLPTGVRGTLSFGARGKGRKR